MPLAGWPQAQLAFKNSMVHGILQFAPRIAFRCALHRCESRDIHCRESCKPAWCAKTLHATKPDKGPRVLRYSLGAEQRRFEFSSILHRRPSIKPRRTIGTAFFATAYAAAYLTCSPNRSICLGLDNDPSAGSPTETLLRLLLPLNDKVQWTSRRVTGGEPPASQRSEHFTGPFNR